MINKDVKLDRERILNYCKYNNWSVLVRKKFVDPHLSFLFSQAQKDLPISLKFLYKYGNTIVDWHSIYWNKNIPLSIKILFKDKIFQYWVNNCFDFRVPRKTRIESLTDFFNKNFGLSFEELKNEQKTNK